MILDVESKVELKPSLASPNGMRKAYFVAGPEGTGTNMMAEALVAAGCRHVYEVDEIQTEDNLVVIRRSLPHAGKWPDIHFLAMQLAEKGMPEFHLILTLRDFHASARSVVRRGYGQDLHQCYRNQVDAIITIGSVLRDIYPVFTYVTYESFCLNEKFRKWLFEERFGLSFPADYQIWYANDQYYKE